MRGRLCIGVALLIALFLAYAPSAAGCPDIFLGGYGGIGEPPRSDRDPCWNQPIDWEGYAVSSERVSWMGLESEFADDFLFDQDAHLVVARWWGGFWCSTPPFDDLVPEFGLRFYEDVGDCHPGALLSETWISNDDCHEAFAYEQQHWVLTIYSYEAAISFRAAAGQRYWFTVIAGDHPFQPQWGRVIALEIQGCEGMFRSAYFAYPDWVGLTGVVGEPYDASVEFDCEAPTALRATSWGAVRALYR